MATPIRPETVPDDAVVLPPSHATQSESIASVKKQIVRQNMHALSDYAVDLETWEINAAIYKDLNMPIPPIPRVPPREVLHVEYADASGNPVEKVDGLSEKYYAWVWQTSDGVWFPESEEASAAG